jgi:hypothetical protein
MNRNALLALGLAVLVTTVLAAIDVPKPVVADPESPAPEGAKALVMWLQSANLSAHTFSSSLAEPPDNVKTIILAAPTARALEAAEVSRLQQWVQRGGTLVYLAVHPELQPELSQWLQLTMTPREMTSNEQSPSVVTVNEGLFREVRRLRLSQKNRLSTNAPDAVSLTDDGALWLVPVEKGAVLFTADATLLQNNTLEQHDNARLWLALARQGPLAFATFYHSAGLARSSVRWWPLAFLVIALLLSLSKRLGPVHPAQPQPPPPASEHVFALTQLADRKETHHSLVEVVRLEFRRWLFRRHGISVEATQAECLKQLAHEPTLQVEANRVLRETNLVTVVAARIRAQYPSQHLP